MLGPDLVIGLVTSPVTGSVLLTASVATPLIGSLGLAIRRSTRRQECARLRDQLVDAARHGELDVSDWRVFSLIDWFDQVANTGRTAIRGRHSPAGAERGDGADSLVASLASALRPLATASPPDDRWSAPAPWRAPADLGFEQLDPRCERLHPGADLRASAVSYRERQQQRRWHVLRLSWPARTRVEAPEIFEVAGSGR